MKMFGRSMALGLASVALVVCSFASQAVAAAPQAANATSSPAVAASQSAVGQVTIHKRGDGAVPPAGLGNPSVWGVAEIKVNASASSISPMSEACVSASGGTWCYGSYLTSGGKYCYSNYLHNTKSHLSSVKMDGFLYSSGTIPAGTPSNAAVTAGAAYTCYTYYSIA